MGGLSIWHWLIVLVVVMLLFGTGKVSNLMGDVAKGIKQFKKNMHEEDASMEPTTPPPAAPPPVTLGTMPPPGVGQTAAPARPAERF